jgi:hypothetical protein
MVNLGRFSCSGSVILCTCLQDGKDWMTQLLAVACLSLAAKMEETDVPQSLDLQVRLKL